MPFTERQQHYLTAMGLTAWVLRQEAKASVDSDSALLSNDASASLVAAETVLDNESPSDSQVIALEQRAVIASCFNEIDAPMHGDSAASLLLVFDADTDNSLELSRDEAKLLHDMLAAINVNDSSIARCLVASVTADSAHSAGPLHRHCHSHIKAVLYLVKQAPSVQSDDAAASRISTTSMPPSWLLPHPTWLQQEPSLKRRAWNVLKSAHAQLSNPSISVKG